MALYPAPNHPLLVFRPVARRPGIGEYCMVTTRDGPWFWQGAMIGLSYPCHARARLDQDDLLWSNFDALCIHLGPAGKVLA